MCGSSETSTIIVDFFRWKLVLYLVTLAPGAQVSKMGLPCCLLSKEMVPRWYSSLHFSQNYTNILMHQILFI